MVERMIYDIRVFTTRDGQRRARVEGQLTATYPDLENLFKEIQGHIQFKEMLTITDPKVMENLAKER